MFITCTSGQIYVVAATNQAPDTSDAGQDNPEAFKIGRRRRSCSSV
jgi:hypothetical protein